MFECSDSGFGYIVLTLLVVWLDNCYVGIVVGFTLLCFGFGLWLFLVLVVVCWFGLWLWLSFTCLWLACLSIWFDCDYTGYMF